MMKISGSLTPWWADEYKELDYKYLPHKDEKMVHDWKDQGYANMHCNGAVYGQDRGLPDWLVEFVKQPDFYTWNNVGIAAYRMNTGDILPVHSDHYISYMKMFNILSNKDVVRCIVFLEDWKSGHYFELDGVANTRWHKGDFISWTGDTPHMAANFGIEPRYTIQITGTRA